MKPSLEKRVKDLEETSMPSNIIMVLLIGIMIASIAISLVIVAFRADKIEEEIASMPHYECHNETTPYIMNWLDTPSGFLYDNIEVDCPEIKTKDDYFTTQCIVRIIKEVCVIQ